MSRQIHIMIVVLVTLAGAFSCANEDKKLTIADQEAAIDSYITQNYANNTVVRRNGSNRVILDSTSGCTETPSTFTTPDIFSQILRQGCSARTITM